MKKDISEWDKTVSKLKEELYSFEEKYNRIKNTKIQLASKDKLNIQVNKLKDAINVLESDEFVVVDKVSYYGIVMKNSLYSKDYGMYTCKECGRYYTVVCNHGADEK